MLISRAAVNDFMDRRLDSYNWMKKLTREQILRELSAFRVRPEFKTEPWLHQLVCFYIGMCRPEFLFLLDMGLGKSKILADLITQVQRERKLDTALIFVPRRSNLSSWKDALIEHSDLEPWLVSGHEIDEKWEQLSRPRGDVTVIDYQGFTLATSKKVPGKKKANKLVPDERKVKQLIREYNFIGLDEIHKLGHADSLWWRLVYRMTKQAEYRYGMTGTLFGKEVETTWSQFKLIDDGETLGENLGIFRAAFFQQKTTAWKTEFVFNARLKRDLNRMLQHRSLRYDEDEVLDLPKRVPQEVKLTMSDEQREHYMRAVEGLINANGKLSELEGQWTRMRQITSGYLAWKDGHGNHMLEFDENPKLDAIERMVDGLGDSKLIICYDYTETGRIICKRLKSLGIGHEWFYGGTKDHEASRKRFMTQDDCQVLVMNSEAGGTGNDGLQKVARYMVFYESPPSPITRKQTEKRLHRPGQNERVFITDLIMLRSQDRAILKAIKDGHDLYKEVVNGRASGIRDLLFAD